ncbi:MAG: transporter associated domain-containing protein, partial [Xenococcus sp. (in: cyanobacteria)]
EGKLTPDSKISSWIEDVNFIPETTPLNELLSLMQRSRKAMVIVIDEFGGTSGLVTLQDLITEIIGDEGESEQTSLKLIKKLDEQSFLVPAQMNLEDVNESLDIDLPLAEDYHTLSGFLLEQWQKIPTQGETISYDNLDFTIVFAEENKLEQVKIKKRDLNN